MARKLAGVPESKAVQWLIAGTAGYTLLIVGCFGVTIAVNSWGEREARAQSRRLADADSRAPVDLAKVAQVDLMKLPAEMPPHQAKQEIANLVNRIRAENAAEHDAYIKRVSKEREDLRGLPLQMGHQCRLPVQAAQQFSTAVTMVRQSLSTEEQSMLPGTDGVSSFWRSWSLNPMPNHTESGVAALSQMLAPEKLSRREALAKQLAEVHHPKATQTLAKQAVFDFDRRVRNVAIEGLRDRPKHEYSETLMQGIRYPWANAAVYASQAIVKLNRKDMIPQLINFLEEADPRDAFECKDEDGDACFKVREVVRINHHRNCLLCHSTTANVQGNPDEIPGLIPSPGESFPPPTSPDAYGGPVPPQGSLIRADVTYLRQDFSVLQPVANAAPWPEMQRFDFLVRTREVNGDELKELVKAKQSRPAGQLSENHQAALRALRELTGKDAGTTAAAWREELGLQVAARK